jgi:tetratricopeptide (TPR) repeat protein
MNQPQLARSYYDSASKMAEARVRQQPEEALFHSSLGMAYAGLGRKQDAIREGKAGVDLLPVSKDAYRGFYRVEELARIYAMVGDYEAAISQLEYLMSIPGDLGVGALRLDPAWKPLRNHPRFQNLLRRYGG